MSARDIPEAQWLAFLDRFSREHRAWLATVDRVRPGGRERREAAELPFASVVPQAAAHRITRIEIRFQGDSGAHAPIRIEAPATVRVDETAEGVARGLDIVDRDGECTRLRFRAAPRPEQLDGIAPGELPPSPS